VLGCFAKNSILRIAESTALITFSFYCILIVCGFIFLLGHYFWLSCQGSGSIAAYAFAFCYVYTAMMALCAIRAKTTFTGGGCPWPESMAQVSEYYIAFMCLTIC
jgi:hypothetical protein